MVRAFDEHEIELMDKVNQWTVGDTKDFAAIISKSAPEDVFEALEELGWRYIVEENI